MDLMRKLPSVDELLRDKSAAELLESYGREYVKKTLTGILDSLREGIKNKKISAERLEKDIEGLFATLESELQAGVQPYLKKVINCTGIIVHTNLGRAPLPENIFERIKELSTGYTNLEFDLGKGNRSSRNYILDGFVEKLFPGYQSVLVNNNAAAVMLVLNTFADGREVIISRGELVEIGGSFRIPDVMEKSGAVLKEVGTTNKTRLSDYEKAVSKNTALIMSVHPSNYKIIGFTGSVTPRELVPVAVKAGLPMFYDMGSGNLFDKEIKCLADEDNLLELVEQKVPIISFSGDKLLGGSQAGVIIALPEYIKKLRSNQLLRALRVDKITYLVFEELLRAYLTGNYGMLPIHKMITARPIDLLERVKKIKSKISNPALSREVRDGFSFVGGGAAPEERIESPLLELEHKKLSPLKMQKKLRDYNPPVITRVENDKLIIDVRTLFAEDEDILLEALNAL